MKKIIEKNGKIECFICGKYFRRVCRHVQQAHGLTSREYKEEFGLDVKRGILTEADRKHMEEKTRENGTINNLKGGEVNWFKKGETHSYTRSEQTKERLRQHGKNLPHGGRKATVEKITIYCAECGNEKKIYPRHYQKGNNYCGVSCRNTANNRKRIK